MSVGWYVHHHGYGHVARFLAVRPDLDAEVTVFSSVPAPARLPARTEWVVVPRDDAPFTADGCTVDPADADPTARGALHWAPIGHPGHAARLAAIAAAHTRRPFRAMVVDVSAEVVVFARLLGVPTVMVTQPGVRDDEPHVLARRLADLVLCPWPRDPDTDRPERAEFVGGISRHAGRERQGSAQAGRVLLLGSLVPDAEADATLRALRDLAPGHTFSHAGFLPGRRVDDPWHELCEASVVVTAAGQNAIADVAAAGCAAIVVPQPRPFDEQHATARRLSRLGLATAFDAWPGVDAIVDALWTARRPDWAPWGVDGAAGRAAAVIARVAGTGAAA